MKITSASRTKRGNIAVYADEEFLFSVQESAWLDSGLCVGDETDEDTLNALLGASQYAAAKRRALNMLSARSYTKKQLCDRLARSHDRENAALAADRMEELGLVNDADYARRFAEELFFERRYARRRIRWEMQKRGISREDADNALEAFADADDLSRAVELLEKKYTILETDADIRRAAALLERYGYPADTIRTAVHAVRRLRNEEDTDAY